MPKITDIDALEDSFDAAAAAAYLGRLGGKASAEALTDRQRSTRARKAGKANAGIPRPSATRSESMKAAWARRR